VARPVLRRKQSILLKTPDRNQLAVSNQYGFDS
jgi:hypothetical protein